MSGATKTGAGDRKSLTTATSVYNSLLRKRTTSNKRRVLNTKRRQTRPGQRTTSNDMPF